MRNSYFFSGTSGILFGAYARTEANFTLSKLAMLHAIRLTQQQLIDQVFRLFTYHNSCIKYFNDTVYLGRKGYILKPAPDGSATDVVRSIEDIGKAKDDFISFDMHGQTMPVIAEKPIITWKYNDNAATAHVETTELLHLYQQLTGNKVVLV